MERDKGFQGRGGVWRLLVKLVQHIWETGEIPYQMMQVVVILISKRSSGDYRSMPAGGGVEVYQEGGGQAAVQV